MPRDLLRGDALDVLVERLGLVDPIGIANLTAPEFDRVGLLGGKDLSTLTGASAGDEVMSDGSSGSADDAAYSTWTFDGADWVRADGQATITPA